MAPCGSAQVAERVRPASCVTWGRGCGVFIRPRSTRPRRDPDRAFGLRIVYSACASALWTPLPDGRAFARHTTILRGKSKIMASFSGFEVVGLPEIHARGVVRTERRGQRAAVHTIARHYPQPLSHSPACSGMGRTRLFTARSHPTSHSDSALSRLRLLTSCGGAGTSALVDCFYLDSPCI